jgi:hypothetical protein
MGQFRKKPIVIEAMKLPPVADIEGRLVIDDWLLSVQGDPPCRYVGSTVEIPTLEGVMTAQPGDWIIQGVKGELYPCRDDIFAATYEAVD